MNQKIKSACAIAAIAALTACGGGGEGGVGAGAQPPAQDAADRYAGIWEKECLVINSQPGFEKSVNNRFDMTKVNDLTLNSVVTQLSFVTKDCTGPATSTVDSTGTIEFVGTKLVGTDVVDKLIGRSPGEPTQKSIWLRKDDKIFHPDANSPVDADGFPVAIVLGNFVTKVQTP